MRRHILQAPVVFLLTLATVAPAGARLHRVPRDYASIQEAIDHSAPFDTVLVGPGRYEGGLVISSSQRGLVLTSERGPRETVLIGKSGSRILTFDETDTLTEVSGFTLRGGHPQFDGGAVYAYRSQILIANCVITGNETQGDGGAIALYESWALLWRNVVSANSARHGGGVFANTSTVTAAGNTFSNNRASEDGGGMLLQASATTLDGNSFRGNQAVNEGGGVLLLSQQGQFRNNVFSRNGARRGGGFVCQGGFQPDLTSNRFIENQPDDVAGCSSSTRLN